jgi:hypothetical protein
MKDDDLAVRSSIVRDIREALDSCDNPYVRTYNTIRDTLHLDGIPTIRLRILGKRGRDGRRYNLPTASEVAALIVGDFDAADFQELLCFCNLYACFQRCRQPNSAVLCKKVLSPVYPPGKSGSRTGSLYFQEDKSPNGG